MKRRAIQPSHCHQSAQQSVHSRYHWKMLRLATNDHLRKREEKKEDSLSVETALENGQRWENDCFWEDYAQPLIQKEDVQQMFEEELRFPESASHDTECSSCMCSMLLVYTRNCIITPCRHRASCYKCTVQFRSSYFCRRPIKNIFRSFRCDLFCWFFIMVIYFLCVEKFLNIRIVFFLVFTKFFSIF